MAGTVTQTIKTYGDVYSFIKVLRIEWTADEDDGSVPDTTIDVTGIQGWSIFALITTPGTTAPTDNYDIVLEDEDEIDLLGGAASNRDNATTERVSPLFGANNPVPVPVTESMVFKLTGNSVNSASGLVKVLLVRN